MSAGFVLPGAVRWRRCSPPQSAACARRSPRRRGCRLCATSSSWFSVGRGRAARSGGDSGGGGSAVREALRRSEARRGEGGADTPPPQLLIVLLRAGARPPPSQALAELRKELALRRWSDTQVIGASVAKVTLSGLSAPDGGSDGGEDADGDGDDVAIALLTPPAPLRTRVFSLDADAVDLDLRQHALHNLVTGGQLSPGEQPAAGHGVRALGMILLHDVSARKNVVENVLASLDFAFPNCAKVGACAAGAAAGADAWGGARAFVVVRGGHAAEGSVVGVAVLTDARGDGADKLELEVIAAQRAREIGPMLEVSEVEQEGREVVQVREVKTAGESVGAPMTLLDMWGATGQLPARDAALARRQTLLGVGMDVFEEDAPPVYVVRRIEEFDARRGALAIDGHVRVGQTVRFCVRDTQGAAEELSALLRLAARNGVEHSLEAREPLGVVVIADPDVDASMASSSSQTDASLGADLRCVRRELRASNVPVLTVWSEQQISPLPAPGYINFFPIKGVGESGSTFVHNSTTVYVVIYAK